jgi:hypothetical protein
MAKSSMVEADVQPLEARYGLEQPYTMELTLRGTTPFLFNRFFDLEAYAESDPGRKKKPRERGLHDYEAMVERDDAGQLAVSTQNVIAAIVSAGKYFKSPISGSGGATTTLRESLIPAVDYASFGVDTWDCIDFRLARNGDMKRTPKPTWRPRLEKGWLLTAQVGITAPEIYGPARLLEVITRSGISSGIGDGRKIGMGRFVLGSHSLEEGLPW